MTNTQFDIQREYGFWLALGLDIVTDGITAFGGQGDNRSRLRDRLEMRIGDAEDDVQHGYDNPWTAETIQLARDWLDISLEDLGNIVNSVRSRTIYAMDERLIFLASGDDGGEGVATVAEEVYADLVREWADNQRANRAVA